MATWDEFATQEPGMADVLNRLLATVPIAYLATTRRDGAPRVHPICPIFAEGRMFVAVNPASPKRFDLKRDGRYALHGMPGERDEEFYATGRARLVEPGARREAVVAAAGHTVHTGDWVFELDLTTADTAYWENWAQPDTYAVRRHWQTGT